MGVALITPFKEDDSVDYEALLRLVDYQLQNGTDFLCVLGTTAETPTLTKEEKDKIKHLVVERVNGRIPILLGISSNCTRTVVESLKNDDFTGVDAVLVAVPYYNKPSQEGIYQHYKAIAEATDLPVVLYNVPGRTGVNMTAETTLRLARDFNNIIAIKEASGNITQMDDIIKNKPANFCRTQRPEDDAAVAVDYEGARNALLCIEAEYPFVRIHCCQVAQISVILLFVACEKLVEALF